MSFLPPDLQQAGVQFAANLAQLIAMYLQERRHQKERSYDDFIQFLEFHKFDEIKDQIGRSAELQSEVNDLLLRDTAQILTKIDKLNGTIVEGFARIEGFKKVTAIAAPNVGLSEQALWVFELAGRSPTGVIQMASDDQIALDGKLYEIPEERFFFDDCHSLVGRGFFEIRVSSSTGRSYRLTRRGYEAFKKMFPNQPATGD